MGQSVARVAAPAALLAASSLGFTSLIRPRQLADRWAVIAENETRIDNVKPFDSVEKWAANGSQAGLHRLNPTRVAYFDKRIRSHMHPPFRVLDAGCGGGLVANALAALPGYVVHGVDMSPQALLYAEDRAARANLTTVTFRNGSIYSLPFTHESFDVVIMSDVLEHLLDLPSAVAEVARVLRPGGMMLFDTIDRTWISYLVAIIGAERIVGIIQSGSHDWRLFIRPKELKKGLEQSGFHSFSHEAFDPSARALMELTLFSAGLLQPKHMAGGWSIGSPSLALVSYIGQAVKGGKSKAREQESPLRPPPQAAQVHERTEAPSQRPEEQALQDAGPGTKAVSTALRRTSQTPVVEAKSDTLPTQQLKVGDLVEVMATAGPKKGSWMAARVVALGHVSNRYDINVNGVLNISNVHASKLRRVEVNHQPPPQPPPEYEVGEQAEVANGNKSWTECSIVGVGHRPKTYDVHVKIMKDPGFHLIKSVPEHLLRKKVPKQPPPVEEEVIFEAGEGCYLRDALPGTRDNWTECLVLRKGSEPNTYDIRVPRSSEESDNLASLYKDMLAVPAKLLVSKEATQAYKVGQLAEVRIFQGQFNGSWVQCVVNGKEQHPDLYSVSAIANHTPGFVEVRNVSVFALRRVPAVQPSRLPTWAQEALRASSASNTASFKVGERAFVRVTGGPKAGSWTKCLVLSVGKKPKTYNIRVKAATKGHHDLLDIPERALRQAKPGELGPVYEVGQQALILVREGALAGHWLRCIVTGPGEDLDAYDLKLVKDEKVVIQNIPGVALRPAPREPPRHVREQMALLASHLRQRELEEPTELFQAGETAFVRAGEGWVRCVVVERGKTRNSYSIRVVSDNAEGFLEVPNVPAHKLRKAARPSTLSVLMWILEIMFSAR